MMSSWFPFLPFEKSAFRAVPAFFRSALALWVTVQWGGSALAADVLAPPPTDYSQKELVALPAATGTNQAGMTPNEAAVAAPVAGQGPLDWGPVHLQPHLMYRLSYGNGIQASPGNQSRTMINQLSPGLLFDLGNHWKLDYTPTLTYYSSKAFRDSTDHSVALNGGTTYQDWTLGLSQSYASSSTPLVETASQTDQETYSTALSVAYQLNDKVSLDASLRQNFLFVGENTTTNQLSDTRTWSVTPGLNYQLVPRVLVGISAGVTYDDVKVGTDMTSEQLQGRINWRPGEKLTLSFTGGFEDRQYLNSSQPASLTPIFNLSLSYKLFDQTTVTLTASRSVSASYFQNQTTDTTGFSVGVQQRLLQKLTLSFSAGYSTSAYGATTTSVNANRRDDHASVDVRLSCPFLKRGTISVYYDWGDNASNDSGYAYDSNQAGLEIGYRY